MYVCMYVLCMYVYVCILQELLIYKYLSEQLVAVADNYKKKTYYPLVFGSNSCEDSFDTACGTSVNKCGDYVLIGHLSFPDPVLALEKVDMTGDGLVEIGVLSQKGLHIMQVFCQFLARDTHTCVVQYTLDIISSVFSETLVDYDHIH